MGHAFRQLYYHVVWTTKGRELSLDAARRAVLLSAIETKCRDLRCAIHAVNAIEDHVHLALEIPPSLAVAAAVGQIKGSASHVLNERFPEPMYWQEGYGAVTFRKGDQTKVCEYIASQEERHRVGALSPALETVEEVD